MLIVPLILSSVITGVAQLGTGPDLGRLGGKTLGVLRPHHADRGAHRAGTGEHRRAGSPGRTASASSAGAVSRRGPGHAGRHESRRYQHARDDPGRRTGQHRPGRGQYQDVRPGAVLDPVRLLPGAHPAAPAGAGARVLAGPLPRHDAYDRFRDAARAHWCVCAHRQGRGDFGIRGRRAFAAVRRLRGGGARDLWFRRAADPARHRGARESVAAVSGHGAGAAHRVLDGFLIRDAAAVARMPRRACEGVSAHCRVRHATGRLDESRRQRVVRMCGGDVHRPGLRTCTCRSERSSPW